MGTPSIGENDQSHQEMSLISKKSVAPQTKHYMSPTISTASEANPPRRKILAEGNELFDIHLQNRSNLDSPNTGCTGDERIGAGVEGLSQNPYDSLTNYLTPRPRFLRYKPERRREIIFRVDNGVKEDDGDGIGGEGVSRWFQEDNVKQELEEEFEEVEEEGHVWKGLVKLLLGLVVLMLFTSYISSMNSPTPSPVVQGIAGCKDGYYMIQDHVYELLKNFDGGKYLLLHKDGLIAIPTDDVGIDQELMTEVVEMRTEEKSDDLSEVVDDTIEFEGNAAVDELGGLEAEIEALEIVENEENVEVNMSELETGASHQVSKLQYSDVTEAVEASITIPNNQDAPDGTSETGNEVMSERSKKEMVDNAMGANDSVIGEAEASSNGDIIDSWATGSFLIDAIGGFLLSVLIALYFQRKRSGRHGISQAVEPIFEQLPEDNYGLVLANQENAKLKYPESSDSSTSFLDSMERGFNEVCRSRAPSVQLLGEFSAEEMSSSNRSYGMTNRIAESGVSSHSVSEENVKNSKIHSTPLHMHSIFSEISSMESPFQKKNEDAESESRKPMTTTPLRRSSRIRSRTIKSP